MGYEESQELLSLLSDEGADVYAEEQPDGTWKVFDTAGWEFEFADEDKFFACCVGRKDAVR